MVSRPHITAIMACDTRGTVGNGRELPWNCPEELEHFRTVTRDQPTLMGRRTYEGLPAHFFETHEAIVLCQKKPRVSQLNTILVSSLEEMMTTACAYDHVYAIGGARLIATLFNNNCIDAFILSTMKGTYPGDTKLPDKLLREVMSWKDFQKPEFHSNFTVNYKTRRPV